MVTTIRAPAKLNLTLEVLAGRPDGYHALRSVMVPIGIYDEIDLEPSGSDELVCSDPSLVEENIVLRALEAARLSQHWRVTLRKVIPVGGGLGGGSSDAAAVLRAAVEGKLGSRAEQDWLQVARSLGSDVPFFLTGTGALVEGTGERVTALGSLPQWWTVVVKPKLAVSTKEAYRLLDESRAHAPVEARPRSTSISLTAVDALQRADFDALVRTLSNDFDELVTGSSPELLRARAALQAAGANKVLLSGSGASIFALFPAEEPARSVAGLVDQASVDATFAAPFVSEDAWR